MSQQKGNTKPRARARAFCWTINNVEGVSDNLIEEWMIKEEAIAYIWQWERGKKTEHLHVQGWMRFENQREIEGLRGHFNKWHIEKQKAKKGKAKNAYEYCRKDDSTKVRDGREKGIPERLEIIKELKDWQLELEKDLMEKPDDRTVIWYVDKEGLKGKSAMAKYLAVKYGAICPDGGKEADIKYIIGQCEENPRIIVIDIPREDDIGMVSYRMLEKLKDGMFMAGKLKSRMVIMNSPHVVVFSNEEPEKTKLSQDRWKVRYL